MQKKCFYIFNKDLASFYTWKERYPDLQAIWYDGSSTLLKGLDLQFKIETLITEDTLESKIFEQLNKNDIKNVISSPAIEPNYIEEKKKICFLPSNDTHVYSFREIAKQDDRFEFYVSSAKKEHAEKTLSELNIPFHPFQHTRKFINFFSGLLLGNDWGWFEQYVIKRFRNNGIPSFCLQESVIDFGGESKRMKRCDYPIIQGIATLKHFNNDIYFLTGNARYEKLEIKNAVPGTPLVAINSNFTYNIFTEIQREWIETIVDACKKLNYDYIILQHPRDGADLSRYNSVRTGAKVVHDYLEKSAFIISRFSSIIHESLAMGRPVIYYNPHKENMYYDFEPDQEHLIMTRDGSELNDAMKVIIKSTISNSGDKEFYTNYKRRHLGTHDRQATRRITDVLGRFSKYSVEEGEKENFLEYSKLYTAYKKTIFLRSIGRT